MPKKGRFDFTKKNKRSGKIENVGYLDLEQDEEQSRCSLYFYGDIVSATWESMWYEEDRCPQDIADFLNQLDGYEDIDIYFNSGGGDVFAGLAIYNQLKRYDGHKVGYVDGMAASIASVIMFACDELHFATGAQAMIHKPLCMAYGNADDFKAVIKQLNLCEDSMRHGSTARRCSSISMLKSKKRQQSQRVHPTILRNTTIFRRHSRELKRRTLSMQCLQNWKRGVMQQHRQRNRELRQKSGRFSTIYTFTVCKKWRTESHE